MSTEQLRLMPSLRRFFANGFEHKPERDAPRYGFVCLETENQTVFVNPETGYTRFGRTIPSC